jgi:cytochrome c peroxidase
MRTVSPLLIAALLLGGCAKSGGDEPNPDKGKAPPRTVPKAPPLPAAPLGLPDTPAPAGTADTPERVALGRLLFFDTRLSDNGSSSCETCHAPEKGWAGGKANARHAPTLLNAGYLDAWSWDGREPTLESQVLAEWTGHVGGTPDQVATALAAIPEYATRFQRAFGGPPTANDTAAALASFVRVGIRSGDSPWDRYERSGDKSQVSARALAGFRVFTERANCALCHAPPLYTDTLYHNTGVGYEGVGEPDPGRASVTGNPSQTGAFKTPTLRGVALHRPYFHDGSAATLEHAVDFMVGGGYRDGNAHLDEKLVAVKLSDEDRADLIEFLRALSPEQGPYPRPTLP